MLADPEQAPTVARELEATVCWMAERRSSRGRSSRSSTTRTVRAIVDELVSVVDIHTLEDEDAPERLELNDIARVRLRLSEPLAVDAYAENRATGAFILIDEATNDTVAAGMILSVGLSPWRRVSARRESRDDAGDKREPEREPAEAAAGRLRPRLVPIAFATRTPGSHQATARAPSPSNWPCTARTTRPRPAVAMK